MMEKRKSLRLYKENKKNLFKNGYLINNIYLNTYDYEFKDILDIPIKDFKKKSLELYYKESDPNYYKAQMKKYYKDLISADIIFGDWWRIGNKKEDIMYYITVSNPSIKEVSDLEIKFLISSHYHKFFGYKEPFYIEPKFYKIKDKKYKGYYELRKPDKYLKIKDTDELIEEWIEKNKDSDIYNYYKESILNNNDKNLALKNIIVSVDKYEVNSYNILVPFNCELTYPELFKKIINKKIKISNYDDKIQLPMDIKYKEFLTQFIPDIPKKISINRKKRVFKRK